MVKTQEAGATHGGIDEGRNKETERGDGHRHHTNEVPGASLLVLIAVRLLLNPDIEESSVPMAIGQSITGDATLSASGGD